MSCTAYPHSQALASEIKAMSTDECVPMKLIHDAAIEIVQGYEDGDAEVESLNLESTEQLKNVILDFLIFITINKEEMDEKSDHC